MGFCDKKIVEDNMYEFNPKNSKKNNELKSTNSFQIKDSKKEENTKPIKTGNRQNFLALLSKFDKPKNTQNQETKKPPPKLIQRDNPFFKSLNAPSLNQLKKDQKEKEEKLKENNKKLINLMQKNQLLILIIKIIKAT